MVSPSPGVRRATIDAVYQKSVSVRPTPSGNAEGAIWRVGVVGGAVAQDQSVVLGCQRSGRNWSISLIGVAGMRVSTSRR